MSIDYYEQLDWPKRVKALQSLIRKNRISNYRIAKVSGLNISTVGRIMNGEIKFSRVGTINLFTSAVLVLAKHKKRSH